MTMEQIQTALIIALFVLLIVLAIYQHEKNQKFGGQLFDLNRRLFEHDNITSKSFKHIRLELEQLNKELKGDK